MSVCVILSTALDSNYQLMFTDLCLLKQKINMYTIPRLWLWLFFSVSFCICLPASFWLPICACNVALKSLREHETRNFSREAYQVEQSVHSVCWQVIISSWTDCQTVCYKKRPSLNHIYYNKNISRVKVLLKFNGDLWDFLRLSLHRPISIFS